MRQLVVIFMLVAVAFARNVNNEDNATKVESENSISEFIDENINSLNDYVGRYLKTSDLSVDLPFGSRIKMDARNFDDEELNFKFDFGSDSSVEARKKSKIKKIFVPILVFILLKALVLVPLALGILGIKTWNAIQLSFVSFVSALALAIWKLCTKVNHDHPPAIIHSAWDPYHHDRNDVAQQMAYSGYAPS